MTAPPNRKLKVFLCHSSDDKPAAREIYARLNAEGWIDPWLDEEKLYPGQDWDREIEIAVEESESVLILLSKESVEKESYVQYELRSILHIAKYKPAGVIFVLPLRINKCEVPRSLKMWQHIDYFPENRKDWAYERILGSLKMRAAKLGIDIEGILAEKKNVEQEKVKEERRKKIAAEKARKEREDREKKENIEKARKDKERIEKREQEKAKQEALEKARKEREAKEKKEAEEKARKIAAEKVRKDKEERKRKATTEKARQGTPYKERQQESHNHIARDTIDAYRRRQQRRPFIIGGFVALVFIVAVIFVVIWLTGENKLQRPLFATEIPTLGIGSTMISEKDGMTMSYVPAGEFEMGSNDGQDDEKPSHIVYLDSFWIDQTEVTNSMYEKCVEEGACNPPIYTKSNTHSSYYGLSSFSAYPVIYVSWYRATDYCLWAGRRLPTEAEWEKAARGTKGLIYPWGNSPSTSLANYGTSYSSGDTVQVTSFQNGKSIYGVYHMAGNVMEWTSSWYAPYPYDAEDGRESSSSSGFSEEKVLRGGAWEHDENSIRSAYRYELAPSDFSRTPFYIIGFRCAFSVNEP